MKYTKPMRELIARAVELSIMLEQNKALYKEMDTVVQQLLVFDLHCAEYKGNSIMLIDNYSKKNTNFKIAAFPRYSLKVDRIPHIAR